MLLCLQLEPWRTGPAEAPLVCACPPPGPVRLEVLGPFPAMFLSEDRAQVLDPVVQGARPARPAPLVGVVRIAEEVVIAVRFSRQLGHITMVAMDRAEAPGPVGIEVELAVSRGDQLRQRFPDSAGAAKPVQRQPGRHEEPTYARHRPQQGIPAGGHGSRMTDDFPYPAPAEEGKPPRRPRKKGC